MRITERIEKAKVASLKWLYFRSFPAYSLVARYRMHRHWLRDPTDKHNPDIKRIAYEWLAWKHDRAVWRSDKLHNGIGPAMRFLMRITGDPLEWPESMRK